MATHYHKYTCVACGAVSLSVDSLLRERCHRCLADLPFHEVFQDDLQKRGHQLVPFAVTREEMEEEALRWMIRGDYTPDDVVSSAYDCYAFPVYLPVIRYEGGYSGNWYASVGYRREEVYTDYIQRAVYVTPHRSELRTEPVTRTRVVIDWHPASGVVQGDFVVNATAATTYREKNLQFIEDGDDELAYPFDDQAVQECVLEPFPSSVDFPAVLFQKRANERVSELVGRTAISLLPGETYKDCRWQFTSNYNYTFVYLPYWLVYFTYDGAGYYALMDGQDARRATGERPYDRRRKKKVDSIWRPFTSYLLIFLAVTLLSFCVTIKSKWQLLIVGVVFTVGLVGLIVMYAVASQQEREVLEASKRQRRRSLRYHGKGGASFFQ